MNIVVTDGFAVNPGDLSWDFLRRFGEVTVYDKIADDEAPEKIGDADAVFTNRVKIGRAVLERCPKLQYVSALGTGYDMIDVAACRERGIEVCNVPGYSTASVAQTAITLLLACVFDMDGYRGMIRRGEWTGVPGVLYQQYRFTELAGKTVGIYGCGCIGTEVGRIAAALGMRVLATRRSKTNGEENGMSFVNADTLIAESDVISFHCPLTAETRGMVNREFISRMKDGAILINTSRGAVMNEADVAAALVSGKLSAFGADVLSKEPADKNNPLLSSPHTVLTPHCAWTSREARERLLHILEEDFESYQKTGAGIHRVF